MIRCASRAFTFCLGSMAVALLAGCGARSYLPVCTQPGATRPCENACGVGSQVCQDERWQACQVPVATRACSNACGPGSQTCGDGAWSECTVPEAIRSCTTACGAGNQVCVDAGWSPCDGPQPEPPTLTGTIWDFTVAHPDFGADGAVGSDLGIVSVNLGADDKPVYASDASTPTTHGAFYFNEWYRDTQGPNPGLDAGPVNETTPFALTFAPSQNDASVYVYANESFFPVDGKLFGNEGLHNYYFTLELTASFRYTGGETFIFTSDDDAWVFLNRKLAVDIGGVHPPRTRSVNLDSVSSALEIEKGQTYPMHVFFADRHPIGSALGINVPAVDFAVCRGAASDP